MANVTTRVRHTLQDRNGMMAVTMNVSVKMGAPENTNVTTGRIIYSLAYNLNASCTRL